MRAEYIERLARNVSVGDDILVGVHPDRDPVGLSPAFVRVKRVERHGADELRFHLDRGGLVAYDLDDLVTVRKYRIPPSVEARP